MEIAFAQLKHENMRLVQNMRSISVESHPLKTVLSTEVFPQTTNTPVSLTFHRMMMVSIDCYLETIVAYTNRYEIEHRSEAADDRC
jgi:hypothetical protein